MPTDVTSRFIEYFDGKTREPVRRFFIGDSDYSSRVLKWPAKIDSTWDQPKPVTAGIELANGDLGMNFLQVDKTLLASRCTVEAGVVYDLETHEWNLNDFNVDKYDSSTFYDSGSQWSDGEFSTDGQYAFMLNTASAVHRFFLPNSGDFRTWSHTGEFNVNSAYGDTLLQGVGINADGTKLIIAGQRHLSAWDLPSRYDIESMTLQSSIDTAVYSAFNNGGIFVSNSGDYVYSLENTYKRLTRYSCDSDCNVTSLIIDSFLPTSNYGGAFTSSVVANSAQDRLFIFGLDDTINMWTIHPDDISSADVSSDALIVNSSFPGGVQGGPMLLDTHGVLLNVISRNFPAPNGTMYTYDATEEFVTLFGGNIDSVNYKSGKCNMRLIDKLQQLSKRLVGNDDVPVVYTNQLLSDVAWWLVTSYGSFDTTASNSNVDINYAKFSTWAGIVSGDNIRVTTEIKGIKVTECLRKIARMSRTSIYIEDDQLVFSRFSDTNVTDIDINKTTSILDSVLSIKPSDIINRQFVQAGYSPASDYFTITVSDELTASINSFGLYEQIEEDTSIWYASSTSALTLAQRITFTDGNPVDRISVKTPLNTITGQLGDTLLYTNEQQGVSENYRIMRKGVNINEGTVTLNIDRSQLVNPFILDVTSLDGTEVLT